MISRKKRTSDLSDNPSPIPPMVDLRSIREISQKSWPSELEIEGWADNLWARNKETEEHTLCVAELTVALSRMLGTLENDLTHVRYGALLHDIGKTGIPERILLKQGRLSHDEWNIVRKHPEYGWDLLHPIEYLRPCLSIPYSHHERWDGTGYPQKLKGREIPLPARLFAVVDVWETLSSDRIYRAAWPQGRVMDYIKMQSGLQFDPEVVELFFFAIETNPNDARLPLAW